MLKDEEIRRIAEVEGEKWNFKKDSTFVQKKFNAIKTEIRSLRAAGYAIVPVEPTEAMLMRVQLKQSAAGYDPQDAEWLREIYRAMLAANQKENGK